MRRMLAAIGLLTVTASLSTACTSGAHAPQVAGATGAAARAGDAAAPPAGPGSTPTVCAAVRAAITADMTPLGTALGSVIGSAVGKDATHRAAAVQDVNVAMRKIATDIAAASAPADSATVRTAADQAVQQVNTLAADPSFASALDAMDDIPAATARLTAATSSIASACQGS